MTVKHRIVLITAVVAAFAPAGPALADPPQLRLDTAAHLGAPDGWATQYADGSGALLHPDNAPRFVPAAESSPRPAAASFDWQAGLIGAVTGGLGVLLAAAATLAVRTRARIARA
jgi:hypothetical protein